MTVLKDNTIYLIDNFLGRKLLVLIEKCNDISISLKIVARNYEQNSPDFDSILDINREQLHYDINNGLLEFTEVKKDDIIKNSWVKIREEFRIFINLMKNISTENYYLLNLGSTELIIKPKSFMNESGVLDFETHGVFSKDIRDYSINYSRYSNSSSGCISVDFQKNYPIFEELTFYALKKRLESHPYCIISTLLERKYGFDFEEIEPEKGVLCSKTVSYNKMFQDTDILIFNQKNLAPITTGFSLAETVLVSLFGLATLKKVAKYLKESKKLDVIPEKNGDIS